MQTDTARTDTARTDTARTDTARTDTARTDTAWTDTARTDTRHRELRYTAALAWGRAALDLLTPTACAGCKGPRAGAGTTTLCGRCTSALPRTLGAVDPLPPLLRGAFWWDEYNSTTGGALRRAKYRPDLPTLRTLSHHLGQACVGRLPRVDAVVPVPQTHLAWVTRGLSPALMLAQGVSEQLGLPLWPVLERSRGRSQAGRSKVERLQNVRGTFHAQRDTAGARILLVDDIVTSGATASACAQALLNAGAHSVTLVAATRAA